MVFSYLEEFEDSDEFRYGTDMLGSLPIWLEVPIV
jgi:hypothetical protein